MRTHRRVVLCAIVTAAGVSACNAILDIHELTDPGPVDGGNAAETSVGPDAFVPLDAGSDVDADATGIPSCSAAGDPDPCTVVEAQKDGSIFPTWSITSNLNISDHGSFSTPVPPEYTDAGPGTLVEKFTKLTWQTAPGNAGGTMSFAAASALCQGLAGGGWRLPTRIEAASLQFRDADLTFPAKPMYEGCVPPGFDSSQRYMWTSTSVPGVTDQAYIADESACSFTAGSKTAYNEGVRCVKGDTKPATFVVKKAAGRVFALDTGLVWERQGIVVQTYAEAQAHCDGLGMRIPIIQEVYGIIDTRTVAMFQSVLFVPPVLEAGSVSGALSQTIFAIDGAGPVYQAVSLRGDPLGQETATGAVSASRETLLRCVGKGDP